MFGGQEDRNSVFLMNRNFVWLPHYQTLKTGRHGFRSIAVRDNTVVHVGGFGERNFEVWILQPDGSFDIHTAKTALNNWAAYPEVFLLE